MSQDFNEYLKIWALSACREWGYPEPTDRLYATIRRRLPAGLRALLVSGIQDGVILTNGHAFTLKGLSTNKENLPYHWFSRDTSGRLPAPNWEWFVHVAEYVRLHRIAGREGLKIVFEDKLMDLALYHGDTLLVYCEVKEKAHQLHKLINGLKSYQQAIDYSVNDRSNDPLRKAKCIAELKPEYFMGVAIGERLEYRVTYLEDQAFMLTRDMIPWI